MTTQPEGMLGRARHSVRAVVAIRTFRRARSDAPYLENGPERGHSCPQQAPIFENARKQKALYKKRTLPRTGMSALRSAYVSAWILRFGVSLGLGVWFLDLNLWTF